MEEHTSYDVFPDTVSRTAVMAQPTGVVYPNGAITAARWEERGLTPPNQPVPVPDYLGPDWVPDWEELHRKTPKDYVRAARNEKTGAIMYYYVPTSFVLRKLDKVARGHNWGTEIIHEGWSRELPSGDKEYVVALQLIIPGMFRPQTGVGSNTFRANNAQDTEAKTRAGAYTAALKNAAKALGIGRDIEEDEGEVATLVTERHNIINILYSKLRERGKDKEAQEVIKRFAPTALSQTGDLFSTAIEFEQLEPIQRELSALATRTAPKASTTTATPTGA